MSQKRIISIKEARKILGKDFQHKSNDEIAKLIDDVDDMAQLALDVTTREREKQALELANVIYDIYKDKKTYDSRKSNK